MCVLKYIISAWDLLLSIDFSLSLGTKKSLGINFCIILCSALLPIKHARYKFLF